MHTQNTNTQSSQNSPSLRLSLQHSALPLTSATFLPHAPVNECTCSHSNPPTQMARGHLAGCVCEQPNPCATTRSRRTRILLFGVCSTRPVSDHWPRQHSRARRTTVPHSRSRALSDCTTPPHARLLFPRSARLPTQPLARNTPGRNSP